MSDPFNKVNDHIKKPPKIEIESISDEAAQKIGYWVGQTLVQLANEEEGNGDYQIKLPHLDN